MTTNEKNQLAEHGLLDAVNAVHPRAYVPGSETFREAGERLVERGVLVHAPAHDPEGVYAYCLPVTMGPVGGVKPITFPAGSGVVADNYAGGVGQFDKSRVAEAIAEKYGVVYSSLPDGTKIPIEALDGLEVEPVKIRRDVAQAMSVEEFDATIAEIKTLSRRLAAKRDSHAEEFTALLDHFFITRDQALDITIGDDRYFCVIDPDDDEAAFAFPFERIAQLAAEHPNFDGDVAAFLEGPAGNISYFITNEIGTLLYLEHGLILLDECDEPFLTIEERGILDAVKRVFQGRRVRDTRERTDITSEKPNREAEHAIKEANGRDEDNYGGDVGPDWKMLYEHECLRAKTLAERVVARSEGSKEANIRAFAAGIVSAMPCFFDLDQADIDAVFAAAGLTIDDLAEINEVVGELGGKAGMQ